MGKGLLAGLGKLIHMGALYVQHVQAAKQAAALGGDAGHRHLHDYFANLSAAQFAGFKVSVAMAANNEADPAMRQALGWIAANAEALRDQPPGQAAAVTAAGASSFEQAVAQLTGWYDAACAGRGEEVEKAVAGHAVQASEPAFETFLAQLDQMHANLDAAIEQARDNEADAWGGCVEDRIAYLSAKIQTGASDPRVEAQIAQYREQQQFVGRVKSYAIACRRAAEEQADEAPTTNDPAGDDDLDAVFGQLEAMRQQALASGELRGERAHATQAWLAEIESVMRAKQRGEIDASDAVAAMQRIYAKRQDMVRDAGPDPAERLPEGSRARALSALMQSLKGHAANTLMGIPRGQTHAALTELFTALARCGPALVELADDAAAAAFERTELRPLARQAHELALASHVTLASPFWECARTDASANSVFFSGEMDLAAQLGPALAARRLDLAASRSGRYYGQARWDLLRASHLAIFDWRHYQRELARHDPDAAASQAAIAYELGLALALGRPVVIVAEEGRRLPFDIDIEPAHLGGDPAEATERLGEAIDHALYGHQRVADDGCLEATRERLLAVADELGRRRVFEGMGWLDDELVRDPVAFQAAAQQMIRESRGAALITPAWPTPAPAADATLFHVTPFSLDWSGAGRDAVRRACEDAGIRHSDGETAKDARILQRIWDGIAAARWVVADVTDLNPNVFIELGMAHALGRPTLIVERATDGQPPPAVRNLEKIEFARYRDFGELRRRIVGWIAGAGG